MQFSTGCSKKKILFRIFRKGWFIFFKTVFKFKPKTKSTLNQKEILGHIAKKLQVRQISQTCLSEKYLALKSMVYLFFDILKTVSVLINLEFLP